MDENVEQELIFLGLIGMIDPPRAQAKLAVALAKGAGIRVMMITGDHPAAAVIATELGITTDQRVVTSNELETLSAVVEHRRSTDHVLRRHAGTDHRFAC